VRGRKWRRNRRRGSSNIMTMRRRRGRSSGILK